MGSNGSATAGSTGSTKWLGEAAASGRWRRAGSGSQVVKTRFIVTRIMRVTALVAVVYGILMGARSHFSSAMSRGELFRRVPQMLPHALQYHKTTWPLSLIFVVRCAPHPGHCGVVNGASQTTSSRMDQYRRQADGGRMGGSCSCEERAPARRARAAQEIARIILAIAEILTLTANLRRELTTWFAVLFRVRSGVRVQYRVARWPCALLQADAAPLPAPLSGVDRMIGGFKDGVHLFFREVGHREGDAFCHPPFGRTNELRIFGGRARSRPRPNIGGVRSAGRFGAVSSDGTTSSGSIPPAKASRRSLYLRQPRWPFDVSLISARRRIIAS